MTLEELTKCELAAEDLALELEGTPWHAEAVSLFHKLLHARLNMFMGTARG